MKLANRLSIAATAVIMCTSLGISYTALNAAEDSEISRLDAQISTVTAAGLLPKVDKLQAVSVAAEQSSTGISVAFFTFNGDVTLVNESNVRFVQLPTESELKRSLTAPVQIVGAETYLMRSIAYSDGEYVVAATSLDSVIENKSQNTRRFFILSFLASILGALAVWWLIRRDVRAMNRLISQANLIAAGSKDVALPGPKGSAEVVELTQALSRMIESLAESRKKMESFLGDSSHELRTPLTVIRGYVELLQKEVPQAQRDKAFARLNSEIARMESLIADLLLLSELGGTPLREDSKVDFGNIVDAAIHDMHELQPTRPVIASVQQDIFVIGDEQLLNQLVANIFANIRRHTQPLDQVNVQLLSNASGIHFVVEDAGPGLSQDAYLQGPRYFQRFDASRSRSSGGSGLGMSIIVAIVESHSGTITFSKSDLGGLRIHITFANQTS
jgi:signal transduction histidine kinase